MGLRSTGKDRRFQRCQRAHLGHHPPHLPKDLHRRRYLAEQH
jgi:hypothetical protein